MEVCVGVVFASMGCCAGGSEDSNRVAGSLLTVSVGSCAGGSFVDIGFCAMGSSLEGDWAGRSCTALEEEAASSSCEGKGAAGSGLGSGVGVESAEVMASITRAGVLPSMAGAVVGVISTVWGQDVWRVEECQSSRNIGHPQLIVV